MYKEVKKFLKSDEKARIFKYKKDKNATAAIFPWGNPFMATFRYFVFLVLRIFSLSALTVPIYRLFGVKIGKNTCMGVDVLLDPGHPELITIGEDCTIGWGAKILTHEGYLRHFRLGRVKIGNNVLVGAFSTIRSGVTIGDDVIIAMGSIVDKDVPAHEVVGGVPEHEIKKLRSLY